MPDDDSKDMLHAEYARFFRLPGWHSACHHLKLLQAMKENLLASVTRSLVLCGGQPTARM
jgi:hypothetical protein